MMKSDLFKLLGLEKLANEEKLKITEDLGEVALDRIATRFEALLTAEQAAEFEALLQNDEAAAFKFLEIHIPDYTSIAQEEMEVLTKDIIDTHTDVMNKLGY